MNKFYSITSFKNQDGVYEIHPCNNDTISGYIQVKDSVYYDFVTKEKISEKDLWEIESFEEENIVYYVKL